MLDTNDVYNDAVRGSCVHIEGNSDSRKSFLGSNVVATLLLSSIAYIGFNYYNINTSTIDQALIVKSELVAKLQIESELQVVGKISDSEVKYLSALREIESELIEEKEVVNLDPSEQMYLSLAMTDIIEDEYLADNSKYTNALKKEIGVEVDIEEGSFSSVMNDFDDLIPTVSLINDEKEVEKNEMSLSLAMSELIDDIEKDTVEEVSIDTRVVVVKKGDTLQGISNKFYGDAMNYKRIIASNDSLRKNHTIYEGQTIILPY